MDGYDLFKRVQIPMVSLELENMSQETHLEVCANNWLINKCDDFHKLGKTRGDKIISIGNDSR